MSIYTINGHNGNIVTHVLPSHDLVIKKPGHSVLELVAFDVVKSCDGVFRAEYGGWIIPARKVSRAYLLLGNKCKKIS